MTNASHEAAPELIIRTERPEDIDTTHPLAARAFEGQPFTSGTEAGIIRALRASGDVMLSLVVEKSGRA
ncbi:putative N-acetyltransferase YhbS [Arthrobacter sp. CAN_A214]|uniref:hypothetical protein n=1 Tax=Arthrobacter sp. CAN_A214 TaxID=2787720 RepID=UPI0018CABE92